MRYSWHYRLGVDTPRTEGNFMDHERRRDVGFCSLSSCRLVPAGLDVLYILRLLHARSEVLTLDRKSATHPTQDAYVRTIALSERHYKHHNRPRSHRSTARRPTTDCNQPNPPPSRKIETPSPALTFPLG